MPETAPIVFLDFDGTISTTDVVDALLEQFAGPQWQRLEDDWRAGRIGSRECLAGQMACVRAEPPTLDAAIDAIALDRGLVPLLEMAAAREMPVHIVSDGFDRCIHRLLHDLPPRLARRLTTTVHASHLEYTGHGSWRASFPFYGDGCAHGCATCKPRVMSELNVESRPTIFVGDGWSDRYAAAAADIVFAKDRLADYCESQAIPYTVFSDLATVAADLERRWHVPGGWPVRRAGVGI